MKKLIAMISAIAVIGTMSLTSFAEITVTPNPELTTTVTLEKGESGYNASYTSDKVNTQTTIVAVKGAEIKTSSIQYINQLAQDSETVINFDLKDELAAGEIVTVYMGGDAIDKTKIGTIAKAAAVQKFTVTFYDEDGRTQLQTAEYESGATLTAPANPSKAEDENYTYAFAGWAVKGTTDVISLPANVTAAAEYVAVYTATEKEVGGGEEEPTYMLGDVYVDEAVDDLDIMLLDYYYAEMYDELDEFFGEGHRFWEDENDPRLLAADVYVDETVDDLDIMLLDYYYAEMYDELDEFFGEGHRFWE